MEKTLKFNSQVATNRFQSEHLLALGLKKETADCGHFYGRQEYEEYEDWETVILDGNWQSYWDVTDKDIPAWSLHRLLCLYNVHYLEFMGDEEIASAYDIVIDAIEMAINGGYFPEKYLV